MFSVSILSASNGFEVQFNQPQNNVFELTFNLGDYSLSTETHDGISYSKIEFDHSIFTNLKGFAELPYLSATVKLSADKNVDLQVIGGDYVEYDLEFPLLPSRGTIYRDQDPSTVPYIIDQHSVTDNLYPENLARSTSPFILKDVRGTSVYVYPFRYNAKKNVLRVYSSITVKLVENNETPENPIPKASKTSLRGMGAIYNSVFINYEHNKDDLTIGDYGDILVICTDRDEDAIEPFIQWKKEKGFDVFKEVVGTNTNVKSLVQQKYDENNDIMFVQLVGDWGDIKCDVLNGSPMDPQLGCVVGTDNVADITVGRISANSPSDVTVQVNKIINYEKNPEAGGDWYSTTTGIASEQGENKGDDDEIDKVHVQIIYDDKLDPFTYDSYNPIYEPSANSNMVTTAINNGTSIINYCGHGSISSWGTTGFNNNDIANLSNGDKLPWIISVACDNGEFHLGTCFAEAWLRKSNGGAIMTLMATISQPWQPPMRGQDYFNDILTGGYNYDDHPAQNGISTTELRTFTGPIIFNGLVLMTAESGTPSDWETAKTWTIFGDPSMQLRTATPDDIALSNSLVMIGVPYETIVTGSNGPVEGAMVSLSQGNNYFSGITDASGSVTIAHTFNPGLAKLVVTGFNTETIYEDVTVVPADGPYIMVGEFAIDDEQGNGNGQADFGESVLLNVSAKNVGIETSTGVSATLSTTDSYITISDNTYDFGDIAANETVQGTGAFAFTLAEDIPDQHNIIFEIEFEGSSKETWVSNFSIFGCAPEFTVNELTIDDSGSGNGDGILDPGETADVKVSTTNSGHADAPSTSATLATASEDLVINSSSFNFNTIQTGTTVEAVFNVTAAEDVTVGTPAIVDYSVSSGNYNNSQPLTVVIGEITVYLMEEGTFTLCIGEFFDTGGLDGEYQSDENITCTFLPGTEDAMININFTSFNIEDNYDFMYIYDGTGVNAPQITGSPFSGSTSPGEVVATNDEGAITIRFTSDYMVNASGWAADISCNLATSVNDLSILEGIKVFPNPATSKLFVSSPTGSEISLYNVLGEKVKSLKANEGISSIDVSGLLEGLYIIQVKNGIKVSSKKVIVKKGGKK